MGNHRIRWGSLSKLRCKIIFSLWTGSARSTRIVIVILLEESDSEPIIQVFPLAMTLGKSCHHTHYFTAADCFTQRRNA